MMSLLGPFSLTTAPFSWPRFTAFMALLAAIAAFSLLGEGRAPNQVAATPAGNEMAIVRFPQSLEDTESDLRQIGLPWFLARQGATRTLERRDDTIDVEMRVKGQVVGHYVERLVALGEGRSKLFVAFVPTDMRLVAALAAPIRTRLDPVSLMRIAMAEHIRSNINGGGFDMNVLTQSWGSRLAVFRKAFASSGRCTDPQTDDFTPCSDEEGENVLRRAYREEAANGRY